MTKCAYCGTMYSKNLNQCPNCGSTRVILIKAEQIRCPKCSEDNDYYSSNCWNCGYKLN